MKIVDYKNISEQKQKSDGKFGVRVKVMYVITKGNWGGAQEYVFSLATYLPKEKYEVVVVCGEGNILTEKLEAEKIRTIHIDSLKRDISIVEEFKSLFDLLKIIKEYKPDVLHLNSSKIGGLGGLAGRIAKVPKIIFTAHGWAFNESRPWLISKAFLLLQWITVLLSHTTIAISRKTRNDIDSLSGVKDKVFVVHNGVGQIDFIDKNTAINKLAEITNSNPSKIIIGTICELTKNKGLDYLINACQNIEQDFSTYIIGEGEEKENLISLVKEKGLQEKIFFTGRIENAKTLLKAFDIFTLTSRKEGLPYTILEAGQASLPVISSRIDGIPEIIENGKSGILTRSGDVAEITKALKYLMDKPDKRAQFGDALKATVIENFSKKKMLEKTIGFYRKA